MADTYAGQNYPTPPEVEAFDPTQPNQVGGLLNKRRVLSRTHYRRLMDVACKLVAVLDDEGVHHDDGGIVQQLAADMWHRSEGANRG